MASLLYANTITIYISSCKATGGVDFERNIFTPLKIIEHIETTSTSKNPFFPEYSSFRSFCHHHELQQMRE